MKKSIFILSLLLLAFTFSCSKDDDGGTITPESSNLKLKSFNGRLSVDVSYSSQGRPEAFSFDSSNSRDITYNTEGKVVKYGNDIYSYNTSGQLETLISSGTFDKTQEFLYNSQGLMIAQNVLIKEGFRDNLGNDLDLRLGVNYTYNTQNQISEVTTIFNPAPNDVSTSKLELIYNANGQVEQMIGKISRDFGTTFTLSSTSDYEYDSKKNPARPLFDALGFENPFVPIFIFHLQPHDLADLRIRENLNYFSANNVTSATRTFYNSNGDITRVSNESMTYQYDGDYPVTGEYIETRDGQAITTFPLRWQYITD